MAISGQSLFLKKKTVVGNYFDQVTFFFKGPFLVFIGVKYSIIKNIVDNVGTHF